MNTSYSIIANLTPAEYHRQYAAAIDAANASKPVEYWDAAANAWATEGLGWGQWSMTPHRPKPEPVTRPWSKPDDVPGPVCWIRFHKQNVTCAMVTAIDTHGVYNYDSSHNLEDEFTPWAQMDVHEYSTDRREWKKCEVTEG